MSNPQISFRLTNKQLAQGLKLIRTVEPTYKPVSLSQLVKTLYLERIVDAPLTTKSDQVTSTDLAEIHSLRTSKPSKAMSLTDFQNLTNDPSN